MNKRGCCPCGCRGSAGHGGNELPGGGEGVEFCNQGEHHDDDVITQESA